MSALVINTANQLRSGRLALSVRRVAPFSSKAPTEDMNDANTRLFIRCLDSEERGTVHPDDEALIKNQEYMGPLAKKWSIVKSTLYNEKSHDLHAKSEYQQP